MKLATVIVTVVWNAASAEQVEQGVTLPIEAQLKQAPRLHELRSTYTEGGATFKLQLRDELLCSDLAAIAELLGKTRSQWPAGASAPRIEPVPCK